MHVPAEAERRLDTLQLELQVVVSHLMGLGIDNFWELVLAFCRVSLSWSPDLATRAFN